MELPLGVDAQTSEDSVAYIIGVYGEVEHSEYITLWLLAETAQHYYAGRRCDSDIVMASGVSLLWVSSI